MRSVPSSGIASPPSTTPQIKEEIRRLDAELDHLWDDHRALRARVRFGDRAAIVARARVEERLERAA